MAEGRERARALCHLRYFRRLLVGRFADAHRGHAHGATRPFWSSDDALLYRHEIGHDANGVAMEASAALAPVGLKKGVANMAVDGIESDFAAQAGNVTMTLHAYDRLREISTLIQM